MRSTHSAHTIPSAQEVVRLVSNLRKVDRRLDSNEIRQIEKMVFGEEQEEEVPADLETVVVLGSGRCEYRVERALELPPMPERRYVVSGGNLMENGLTEAVNMEAQLVAGGVSSAMIVKEPRARNTRQNLEFVLPLVKGFPSQRIGLITGGFHMRRTLRAATEVFSEWPTHLLYPISAFGPRTTPGTWPDSRNGRRIIADELEKLQHYGLLATRP